MKHKSKTDAFVVSVTTSPPAGPAKLRRAIKIAVLDAPFFERLADGTRPSVTKVTVSPIKEIA